MSLQLTAAGSAQASPKTSAARRITPNAGAADGPNGGWATFPGLWERANLVRAFLWHQQYADARSLLKQFLVRLRRFYSVDFCFGALLSDGDELIDAAGPLAGLGQSAAGGLADIAQQISSDKMASDRLSQLNTRIDRLVVRVVHQ